MARKERVFTVQRDGAHATLDGVIVDLDTAISQEQILTVPVLCYVFERQPGWKLGRDLSTALGKPLFKGFYARLCFLLANGAAFISRQDLYPSLNTVEDFDLLEALVIPPFVGLFETRITRPICTGSVS